MAYKRKIMKFKDANIIEIIDFVPVKNGVSGCARQKKKTKTSAKMKQVNQRSKKRNCHRKMLHYMENEDLFITMTYAKQARPSTMNQVKKDFQKFIRKVKKYFEKNKKTCRWIKNIEKAKGGNWHIHLVLKNIDGVDEVVKHAWVHGGVYIKPLKKSKYYGETFNKIAGYLTKEPLSDIDGNDEVVDESDVLESAYSCSRNMPLPNPEVEELRSYQKEIKVMDGYYIAENYEGINEVTGHKYRYCIMVRL